MFADFVFEKDMSSFDRISFGCFNVIVILSGVLSQAMHVWPSSQR